jgi:ribosome-binding protein aMBF1 (putative translation factor)
VPSSDRPVDHVLEGHWPRAKLDGNRTAFYCQAIAAAAERAIAGLGWSRRELARRAGISRPTLSNVLDGLTAPNISTLAQLETALEVELLPPDRLPGVLYFVREGW